MNKYWFYVFLIIIILSPFHSIASACNETQTNEYVAQILFGSNASERKSDERVQMLLQSLYLCSEQSDGRGQDKLIFLKNKKVKDVPDLSELDISGKYLLECSHIGWDKIYTSNTKVQNNRKKLLQNTINKVFDPGFFEGIFGKTSEKNNSFAAFLYYLHILADYLADSPTNTENYVNGNHVHSFAGQPCTVVNGDKPSFTENQKSGTESFINFSTLDNYGRAGIAFGTIGPDTLDNIGPRLQMTGIKPSGWDLIRYPGLVPSEPPYLYNRCHLIAHGLGGVEEEKNLVTCTRFLNESGMLPLETVVMNYLRTTKNHVFYRVTPIFNGENKLVSGIQMEAYSVEDSGAGISFNRYCYNVQPGIHINYITGNSELADVIFDNNKTIDFVTLTHDNNDPDLINEINKHLSIIFDDQINTNTYIIMMGKINSIAHEARSVIGQDGNSALRYIKLNLYKYEYFNVLKEYIPLLLAKEPFFMSVFN